MPGHAWPAVDATRYRPPPNVALERFAPHAAVLPQAALVVAHAGHGTVMAALSAGVPLVAVPMGRDQPDVARRAERHGTGVSVPADASTAALRAAIDRCWATRHSGGPPGRWPGQ